MHMKTARSGAPARTSRDGEIWMSPQRDIVHNFFQNIVRAMQLLQGYANSNAVFVELLDGMDAVDIEKDLLAFATKLKAFVDLGHNTKERISVTEAAKQAGLTDGDPRVMAALGHALLNVMLSHYWAGMREMLTAGHNPFTENDVLMVTEAAKGINIDG